MNTLFPSVQNKIKNFIITNQYNNTKVDAVDICVYIGLRADITMKNIHHLLDTSQITHERHGFTSSYIIK